MAIEESSKPVRKLTITIEVDIDEAPSIQFKSLRREVTDILTGLMVNGVEGSKPELQRLSEIIRDVY